MKTFEFKQHDPKKNIPVAVVYILIVFLTGYFWLGGIDGMAATVNNSGSAKGIGLLVGVLIIGPFILLLQVMNRKVRVTIDGQMIRVTQKTKDEKIVPLHLIDSMTINIAGINKMAICDEQHTVLLTFHPSNAPSLLMQIAEAVNAHLRFTKEKGTKKFMGTAIDTLTYKRK